MMFQKENAAHFYVIFAKCISTFRTNYNKHNKKNFIIKITIEIIKST